MSNVTASSQAYSDSFYDVPSQAPAVRIALPSVRIHRQHIPLHVNDTLLGGPMSLMGEVEAEVSLNAKQRGIHMSRIEQAFQHGGRQSMVEIALAIAGKIQRTQQQETARVHLRALAPIVTSTPVTGLSSPDTVEISATAVAGPNPSVTCGVAATIITACPCMQGYALTELIEEIGAPAEEGLRLLGRVPIATHSQKGRVSLSVSAPDVAALPGLQLLYQAIADHTVLTQELLKRPDEYAMVRRAHLQPQFVEDVARDTAAGLAAQLLARAHDLGSLTIRVTADSYESIHGHDIQASLEVAADELARLGDERLE